MSATNADAHKPKHPYHLVDPSPWPLVGAIAAIALTYGALQGDAPGAVPRAGAVMASPGWVGGSWVPASLL